MDGMSACACNLGREAIVGSTAEKDVLLNWELHNLCDRVLRCLSEFFCRILRTITTGPTRDAITKATTRKNQNNEEARILCGTVAVACSSLRCFGLRGNV
jgi:hypothetical protein